MDKRKSISADIHSEEEYGKILETCKDRGITRAEFLREAVELHLNDGPRTKALLDERKRLERRLKASENIRNDLEEDLQSAASTVVEKSDRIEELESQIKNVKENESKWRSELNKVTEHLECPQNAHAILYEVRDITKRKDSAIVKNCNLQSELDLANDQFKSMTKQRDTFKHKFEQLTHAFGKLREHIIDSQKQGLLGRIFNPQKIDLVQFRAEIDQENGEPVNGEESHTTAEA